MNGVVENPRAFGARLVFPTPAGSRRVNPFCVAAGDVCRRALLTEEPLFRGMESVPPIGHRVIRLDSVDSTNTYAALALSRGEASHGTAVVALEQTQGRGQRGRSWATAKGLDLAVSVVLLPRHLAASGQFLVAKAAALAVHDVVAGVLAQAGADPGEVRIKWPNDVLVGRSKVAGILIMNELQGLSLASSVVGIGLNVNSRGGDSVWQATSLLQETRLPHGLDELLEVLFGRLEHWWRQLPDDAGRLSKAYADLLWGRGRFGDFLLDGRPFKARPLDVDGSGRLLVEDEAGGVSAYGLERLKLLR